MAFLARSMVARPVVLSVAGVASARALATGTVKWFSTSKGYGFIQTDDETPKEVFVHQTAVEMEGYRYLTEGEKVSFDVQKTERGLQALHVKGVNGPLQRDGRQQRPSGGKQ